MGKQSRLKLGQRHAPAQPGAQRAPAASAAERMPRQGGQQLLFGSLLVGVVAAIVYLNGIPGGFVFDDKLIQRDARIRGDTSFATIFVTDYWYKYIGTSADLYRPLTIASYALNYRLAGLSTPAFHIVNIALHVLFSVLLVYFVDALLRDRALAVVAGLLFATHPVHTEAVTGIVGRAEVLSGLFLLAALYLHVRRYVVLGYGARLWLPVALLAYFCALLSKETAIVGPGLLLLIEYTQQMQGGDVASGRRWWPALGIVGLYVGVAAVYVIIRFSIVGQLIQKPPARSYLLLFGQPLVMRFWTALEIFATYLRLLLYPATLSADYSYRQVALIDAPNRAAVVGACAAVGACAGFVWAVRRRAPVVVFAIGFFAIPYSLVSNLLIPLQVLVAERLMYLPSLGFSVGLAYLWVLCSRRAQAAVSAAWLRHVPAALLAVILVLYSVRTVVRNFDWRDSRTLYAATVAASPDCFAAHFNYSAVLMGVPGQEATALEHLLRAYEIRQDHYPSLVNLSTLYLTLNQPEKALEIARVGQRVRPGSKELQGILKAAEARLQQGK